MSKLIDGKNYFNPESLQEMVAELESGETIGIYIDCIGHTRTIYETSRYVDALKEKFGNRLLIDNKSNFYAEYTLK